MACWFDQGLDRQSRADGVVEAEEKRALLVEAGELYERALALDPSRGAVLNNLAGVYSDLGRTSDAERLFVRAVAQEERLRPFFRRNFADFLVRQGDWERAADQYRRALEEAPDDFQAHQGLVGILSERRPEAFPEYLWFLIGKGQVLSAEEVALQRLKESTASAEALLTVLVAARAAQSRRPDELSPSEAAPVLQALVERPEIGEGAREVLQLHAGEVDPGAYEWWTRRGEPVGGFGQSPRQVFRHLIRSLGEAEQRVDRFGSALGYFRLAVLLSRDELDLEALRLRLSLPPAFEEVEAVDRLADWNEEVLRRVGADARELALYRHDLGLFYGFLEQWGDGTSASSGIYQLAQAASIASTGRLEPPDTPPDTPTFDARIYSRLAAGYAATGEPKQARQALLDLVDAYRLYGMPDEADALMSVLKPRRPRRPSPERRKELDDPPLLPPHPVVEPPKPPVP